MAQQLEVYKCSSCGNITEMLHGGEGVMTCCGSPMQLMVENTVDASREKHVPVIERGAGGITVKVGTVPHPMEASHFIEWIEVIADGNVYRRFLKPGDAPEASFPVTANDVIVREFCNLHGQWSAKS